MLQFCFVSQAHASQNAHAVWERCGNTSATIKNGVVAHVEGKFSTEKALNASSVKLLEGKSAEDQQEGPDDGRPDDGRSDDSDKGEWRLSFLWAHRCYPQGGDPARTGQNAVKNSN